MGLFDKIAMKITNLSEQMVETTEKLAENLAKNIDGFASRLLAMDSSVQSDGFTLYKKIKVADLKRQFNERFGSVLRVYIGRSQVDDNSTLGEAGLTSEGVFECRGNLQVGTFITRMAEEYGLKVKVYTVDEWVAVIDGLTLSASGIVKKNATKADMEMMLSGRTDTSEQSGKTPISEVKAGAFAIVKYSDNSYSVSIDGNVCANSKGAMRQLAEAIGFEYDNGWTTQQLGAKLSKYIKENAGVEDTPVVVKEDTAAAPAEEPVKIEVEEDVETEAEIEDEEFDEGEFEEAEDPIGECEFDNVSYDIFTDSAFAQYLVEDGASEKLVIPDTVTFEGKEYPVTYWGAGDDGVKVVELGKNVNFVDALHAGCGCLEKLIIHSNKGFIEWENEDGDSVSSAEECFPGVEITYVTAPSIKKSYTRLQIKYYGDGRAGVLAPEARQGMLKTKTVTLPKKVTDYGDKFGYSSIRVIALYDRLELHGDRECLMNIDINGASNEYIKTLVDYEWLH